MSRSTGSRLLIAVSSMLLYALIFPHIYPSIGLAAAMLNVIPAVVFGWVLGIRGGLFFGFLAVPVNYFLFWIVGDSLFKDHTGNIIGATAMAFASTGVGWVRDLNVRVHKQADELQAERKLLQEEIARRTRAEEKLTHEALHDPLTSLPNRRLFLNRLEHAHAWSKRNPDNLCSVLYLDLDKFKTINDSLGHNTGDQLLMQVAGRLKASVRDIDTVARMGGDEFAILLEATSSPEDVKKIIQRIQMVLALPYELQGNAMLIGASIGVVMSISAYKQIDDFLGDADAAMYHAKASGDNQFKVFEVGMGE
jgi:diguanylate cyclase (GGDEF)-like protein